MARLWRRISRAGAGEKMKKIIFGILVLLFTTTCFAAKFASSYKGCRKLATKHNMTVVIDNEQMFYAECKNPSFEQKSYVLYYIYKPYTDLNVNIICCYINGEFCSKIKSYNDGQLYNNYYSADVSLSNERAVLSNSTGEVYLTDYGIKHYTALLKYYRADLLIKFNKELGIFIPDDKRKEYQLDNIDKLKKELV